MIFWMQRGSLRSLPGQYDGRHKSFISLRGGATCEAPARRNPGARLDLCWWPYCTDMLACLGITDMDERVVLASSFQSRIHERSVLEAAHAPHSQAKCPGASGQLRVTCRHVKMDARRRMCDPVIIVRPAFSPAAARQSREQGHRQHLRVC